MNGRFVLAARAGRGQRAFPVVRRRGPLLPLRLGPAQPGPAVGVAGVRIQVRRQAFGLRARQRLDLLQQCHHALAVRAEQDRQRQFLQQLHGSRAPIAGVRHQAGHVAQFRDARAPQPSGPAAADDERGDGLVHHQPGRLEPGQPDLTAITHQGDVVIEVFEPIAVPAGRLRGRMGHDGERFRVRVAGSIASGRASILAASGLRLSPDAPA